LEAGSRAELLRILQQANNGDYGELVIPSQHISQVRDEEIKRQLRRIERTDLKRADSIAQLIAELSGRPKVRLPKTAFRPILKEMLALHIKGEKRAITIYQRALQASEDELLKKELPRLQREETTHLRLLQRLLENL
jgi:bacterioferritin (cytochrome b1)